MHHSILFVVHLYKLAEPTRIVIVSSLRVTESLQHWSRTEYGLFDAAAVRTLLTKSREVMQEEIRALSFAGATFAADDDALVRSLPQHAMVSGVGDREYVRR